jgi:ATP-dependent helicase/nuclease subunit B
MARQIDAPATAKPAPIPRPEPKPALALRPKRLTVTEIETLIRDPYAVYAKHVLRLQPLDALGAPADARTKGNVMHEALGRFIGEWTGPFDATAEAHLLEIGREVLREIEDQPDVHAVWSHRFRAIAHWLIGFEASRTGVEERHVEIKGALPVPMGSETFTLVGRADRVDLLSGDALAIYDFKTGTPQTTATVFADLTPQMTLEAAMAKRGAFEGIAAGRTVADLAWLAIGKCGRDEPYIPVAGKREKFTPDQLADRAYDMLAQLIAAYADAGRGYLSRARPMTERRPFVGDHDHLARIREWALVESEPELAG